MNSILTSVKKQLGLDQNYTAFDEELIIHINSVLSILYQLGIGPPNGYAITGASEQWTDFFESNNRLNYIKSYVYLKVKMIFDPSANSSLNNAIDNLIKELEWRIQVEKENED